MKKIISAMLVLFVLAGCLTASAEEIVTIYIPPFVGRNMEQIRIAEDMGFLSAEKQPDDEVICTMSMERYRQLRDGILTQLGVLIDELKVNLPHIESIEYAEDLSRFDVYLNAESMDLLDYLMTMTVSASLGIAQSVLSPDVRPESGVLTLYNPSGNILLQTKYEDAEATAEEEVPTP